MQNRLSLFSVLISSSLSIILIAVYMEMSESQRRQTKETTRQADLQEDVISLQREQAKHEKQVLEIQENQTRVMERQTELMRTNHSTAIEIENYRTNGEKLILDLSNYGNGVATNLELVVLTGFKETDELGPDIASTELIRQSTANFTYRRGSSIKAGEDKVSFEAEPGTALQFKSPDQTIVHGIGAGMDPLVEEGIELLEIYFYVRHQDLLGEYHLDPVFTLEVTPNRDYRNIEQVYREAGRHPVNFPIGGQPEISPDDLSFDLSDVEIPEERTVV